jgi:hypothetical protein
MQEFLALLRLHGVPVTPAHGMPSGPRTVNEPVEKRSVVGRGLRHPQATYAAALQQASQRPRQRAHSAAACAGGGCGCRRPAQQRDAEMADAAQPPAASASAAGQPATEQRPSAGQMEAAVCSLLEAVVPQHMRQVGLLTLQLLVAGPSTVCPAAYTCLYLYTSAKLGFSRMLRVTAGPRGWCPGVCAADAGVHGWVQGVAGRHRRGPRLQLRRTSGWCHAMLPLLQLIIVILRSRMLCCHYCRSGSDAEVKLIA